MKEYEYIVEALERYLCDELTGVICSENYRNKSYEHGYRKIFLEYRRLHRDFCANREKFTDLSQEQGAIEEFQRQCEMKSKDIQVRFLQDMQVCTDVDMKSFMDDYLKKLEDEEVKTVAKRICLYPYLVSVLRTAGKGEESDGKKFQ